MISDKLVKIFDLNKNLIGKGSLLNLSSKIMMVKGTNLPVLSSGTEIVIEIYDEFSGISQYFCHVSIATVNQLNAFIIRKKTNFERRNFLKVRTDLSFYVENIYRNGEDVTKDFSNMKINLLNLSIGGMLISSNYELFINDVLYFDFHYENSPIIMLKAMVIRIDAIYDNNTKQSSIRNYGCIFEQMPSFYEDMITKYLYIRQLQLFKNIEE